MQNMGGVASVEGLYDWSAVDPPPPPCATRAGRPCTCYVYTPDDPAAPRRWDRAVCDRDILDSALGTEFHRVPAMPNLGDENTTTVLVHWGEDGTRLYLQRHADDDGCQGRPPRAVVVAWAPTPGHPEPPAVVTGAYLRTPEFLRLSVNAAVCDELGEEPPNERLAANPDYRVLRRDTDFRAVQRSPAALRLSRSLAAVLAQGPRCLVCMENAGDVITPCACRVGGLCRKCLVLTLSAFALGRCPTCRTEWSYDPSQNRLTLRPDPPPAPAPPPRRDPAGPPPSTEGAPVLGAGLRRAAKCVALLAALATTYGVVHHAPSLPLAPMQSGRALRALPPVSWVDGLQLDRDETYYALKMVVTMQAYGGVRQRADESLFAYLLRLDLMQDNDELHPLTRAVSKEIFVRLCALFVREGANDSVAEAWHRTGLTLSEEEARNIFRAGLAQSGGRREEHVHWLMVQLVRMPSPQLANELLSVILLHQMQCWDDPNHDAACRTRGQTDTLYDSRKRVRAEETRDPAEELRRVLRRMETDP
jgi:hypothetical protein